MLSRISINKWSVISIALSIIGIVACLFVEYSIFIDYQASTGKTQALFGLNELLGYSEKYLISILGFLCLIFTVVAKVKKEKKSYVLGSLIAAMICLILPIIRIWRFFI